jgi:opacity protein-like surface antigen
MLAALLLWVPAAAWAEGAAPRDWSGPYLGAHLGYLWGEADYVEPDAPAFGFGRSADGVQGGLLAGYNHQLGRFVLGLEADGGLTGAGFESDASGGNGYSAVDLDWNARLRGRLGVALDRTLLFLAGGLAVGGISLDDTDPGFGDDGATHVGWTLGGGAEHALTDRLILRLEYLYDDYGRKSYTLDSPPGPFFPSYGADLELTAHTLRAAVAWRF